MRRPLTSRDGKGRREDEPRTRAQTPSEADALPLAARDERSPFPERRLQPFRELFDQAAKLSLDDLRANSRGAAVFASELEVLDERAVPQLDRGIDPCSLAADLVQPGAFERLSIDCDHSLRAADAIPDNTRRASISGTRGADDGDVGARRDGQCRLFEDGVSSPLTTTSRRSIPTPPALRPRSRGD